MIWILFLLFIAIGVVIALLANRFLKNKYYKYFIAILPFSLAIYSLTQINGVEGFHDLGYFLMFLFFILTFFSLTITSVILDLRKNKKV